jgi:hypothetical protein
VATRSFEGHHVEHGRLHSVNGDTYPTPSTTSESAAKRLHSSGSISGLSWLARPETRRTVLDPQPHRVSARTAPAGRRAVGVRIGTSTRAVFPRLSSPHAPRAAPMAPPARTSAPPIVVAPPGGIAVSHWRCRPPLGSRVARRRRGGDQSPRPISAAFREQGGAGAAETAPAADGPPP